MESTTTLRRIYAVAAASVLVWGPLALWQGWELYQAEPWRFAVGVVGFEAILFAVWRHAGRTRTFLSTILTPTDEHEGDDMEGDDKTSV